MATNTFFKRLAVTGFALAFTLIANNVSGARDWMPLLPDQDFYDFQLFAPPDLQEYSIYPEPNEGVFFEYDRLYWSIAAPRFVSVGNQGFWPIEVLSPTAFPDLYDPNPNDNVPVVTTQPIRVLPFGTGPASFDLDTSWLGSDMTWGNRYEGGWIYDDYGLMLSGFVLGPQSQSITTLNSFGANTPNVTQGNLPITITTVVPGITPVTIQNTINYLYYIYENTPPDHQIDQEFTQTNNTSLNSFEIDFLRRVQFNRHTRDTVDFSLGARYFQLQDEFRIDYRSYTTEQFPVTDPTERTLLQTANWRTLSSNNLIGPQIGIRGRGRKGRWSLGYDFKFAAEMNFVNTSQRGSRLSSTAAADYFRGSVPVNGPATQFPPNQTGQPTAPNVVNFPPVGVLAVQNYGTKDQNQATSARNQAVFAPLGEWRFDTAFQVSKAITLRLGYSGMWLGGISRASRRTEYARDTVIRGYNADGTPIVEQYDQIAISKGNNWDYLFINGVDFGIEINR